MLDPLQQQLRAIVDLLPEGEDFALAGGGALIVRGVITRPTGDLAVARWSVPRRSLTRWSSVGRGRQTKNRQQSTDNGRRTNGQRRTADDDTSWRVTNPNAVSARPNLASDRGWELLIRGAAGAPLRASDPYRCPHPVPRRPLTVEPSPA